MEDDIGGYDHAVFLLPSGRFSTLVASSGSRYPCVFSAD